MSSTWLIRNRVTFSGNYAEIAWESFEYLPNSRRLQPRQFCLVFESFSGNLCVTAFKVTRLLIQILAQFCIEKSIPTPYELISDTYMSSTLPILYQKAFVELFPAPFPAKKALLPHMSLSVLVTCLLLAPFSIRKTLLPHKSSFLLISGTFLAAFSIGKAFLPHMSFFLLVTCHWKALLPNMSSFFANYIPFTGLFLHH